MAARSKAASSRRPETAEPLQQKPLLQEPLLQEPLLQEPLLQEPVFLIRYRGGIAHAVPEGLYCRLIARREADGTPSYQDGGSNEAALRRLLETADRPKE